MNVSSAKVHHVECTAPFVPSCSVYINETSWFEAESNDDCILKILLSLQDICESDVCSINFIEYTKYKIKSLLSRYYVEACNEWPAPSAA